MGGGGKGRQYFINMTGGLGLDVKRVDRESQHRRHQVLRVPHRTHGIKNDAACGGQHGHRGISGVSGRGRGRGWEVKLREREREGGIYLLFRMPTALPAC